MLDVLFRIDQVLLLRVATPAVHWIWRTFGMTQFLLAWWLLSLLPMSFGLSGAFAFSVGEYGFAILMGLESGWFFYRLWPLMRLYMFLHEEYLEDPADFENPHDSLAVVSERITQLLAFGVIVAFSFLFAFFAPSPYSLFFPLMCFGVTTLIASNYAAAVPLPPARKEKEDVPADAELAGA